MIMGMKCECCRLTEVAYIRRVRERTMDLQIARRLDLMLAFVAGSTFAQAPRAFSVASPKIFPAPVASPPPPISVYAPANAPLTVETPASSTSSISPPSIAVTIGGSPTKSPNSTSLNRVIIAGLAIV